MKHAPVTAVLPSHLYRNEKKRKGRREIKPNKETKGAGKKTKKDRREPINRMTTLQIGLP